MKRYYTALTIAGSDSCGGAGIQADIKTMSALGVYASSAISAITVQNTTGVFGIQKIEPEIVSGQIEAVMDDIHPQAIKIGMVNDGETIHTIAETLKKYLTAAPDKQQASAPTRSLQLIIDPVMVSTSGCQLMQKDALEIFIEELLPLATLLTPNIPEAEILAGRKSRMLMISGKLPHPLSDWGATTFSSKAVTLKEQKRWIIFSRANNTKKPTNRNIQAISEKLQSIKVQR